MTTGIHGFSGERCEIRHAGARLIDIDFLQSKQVDVEFCDDTPEPGEIYAVVDGCARARC